MTTPDPQAEKQVDEQPEEENPIFLISVDRLNQLDRSPVHLVAGRLASTSPSKSKPIKELGSPAGAISSPA